MMRIVSIYIMCVLLVLVVAGCSDEKDYGNILLYPDDEFKTLTMRDNVLFNLQKAWNERNINQYDMLLDAGFVFHFSSVDVKNGNVSVTQWGRAEDLASAQNLFDPNFGIPGRAPVSSIGLTLTYTEGEGVWSEITPNNEAAYPDEFWYEKTVSYNLTVTAGDFTYTVDNLLASFVVRWAYVDGEEFWRIVAWRDDISTRSELSDRDVGDLAGITETTWGRVKDLYFD